MLVQEMVIFGLYSCIIILSRSVKDIDTINWHPNDLVYPVLRLESARHLPKSELIPSGDLLVEEFHESSKDRAVSFT